MRRPFFIKFRRRCFVATPMHAISIYHYWFNEFLVYINFVKKRHFSAKIKLSKINGCHVALMKSERAYANN